MKVAAVCVLYNPEEECLKKNLTELLKQVDELWLIDNSPNQLNIQTLSRETKKIHYIHLEDNMGIAFALNKGCEEAINSGYEWILTMDQDSCLPTNCIEQYKKTIEKYKNEKIGIVTCDINICETDTHLPDKSNPIEEVDSCWTSGALMNAYGFAEVGGFINELFIDGVDVAYCLALREKGYRIIKNNNVILNHQLGRSKSYKLFGHHLFYVTNHNRMRRYYITRNYLWITKRYGKSYPNHSFTFLFLLKTVFQILFFEKDKIGKYRSIIRGFLDYKKNKYGKYIG